MKILIKQAHVIDPQNNLDDVYDLLIEKKKIVKIAKKIVADDAHEINGHGKYLFPGFVDLHVHFRDPGLEYKETILTGADAARSGGFVAAVTMPNTVPATDEPSIIESILKKAEDAKFTILPCAAITMGRKGKELTELADLKVAGCVAISDDGDSVADALLFRRALEYASMLSIPVLIHAEDKTMSKNGMINEGTVATRMGLKGIPNAAEDIMIARDIELARLTGARIHFQHISTRRGVDLIKEAQEGGVHVTAEVTPHHLALTDEDIPAYNTNFKINPPLRTKEDQTALFKGLKKGIITAIATDHAPHHKREKDVEFDQAPCGTIGLETALAVVLQELYHTKTLSLSEIVKLLNINPKKVIGIDDFAEVREGLEANICLIDINKEWTVQENSFRSKSTNSCFLGRQLKGKVVATICQGNLYEYE